MVASTSQRAEKSLQGPLLQVGPERQTTALLSEHAEKSPEGALMQEGQDDQASVRGMPEKPNQGTLMKEVQNHEVSVLDSQRAEKSPQRAEKSPQHAEKLPYGELMQDGQAHRATLFFADLPGRENSSSPKLLIQDGQAHQAYQREDDGPRVLSRSMQSLYYTVVFIFFVNLAGISAAYYIFGGWPGARTSAPRSSQRSSHDSTRSQVSISSKLASGNDKRSSTRQAVYDKHPAGLHDKYHRPACSHEKRHDNMYQRHPDQREVDKSKKREKSVTRGRDPGPSSKTFDRNLADFESSRLPIGFDHVGPWKSYKRGGMSTASTATSAGHSTGGESYF